MTLRMRSRELKSPVSSITMSVPAPEARPDAIFASAACSAAATCCRVRPREIRAVSLISARISSTGSPNTSTSLVSGKFFALSTKSWVRRFSTESDMSCDVLDDKATIAVKDFSLSLSKTGLATPVGNSGDASDMALRTSVQARSRPSLVRLSLRRILAKETPPLEEVRSHSISAILRSSSSSGRVTSASTRSGAALG